jgi:hypothetical protein
VRSRVITDVAIDLDGVVFDFAESATFYFSRHLNKSLPRPTTWEFYTDWGLEAWEFYTMLDELTEEHDIYDSGAPLQNTIEGWNSLVTQGVNIHVITHRSPRAYTQTCRWLERFNMLADSLHFTGNKPETLHACAVGGGALAAIDDNIHQYDAYIKNGVKAYLYTQPWNSRAVNASRVSDLMEFAEAVRINNDFWHNPHVLDNLEVF